MLAVSIEIFVLAGTGVVWIIGLAIADIVRTRRSRRRAAQRRSSERAA